MWSRPELSSCTEIPVHQTALGSPIHPAIYFDWGFERQVLWGNLCCSFSAPWCLLISSSQIFSPILPFCLDMRANCVWWGARGDDVKSSTFIIWNRATTGCLRVFEAMWKCPNLKSKMSKKNPDRVNIVFFITCAVIKPVGHYFFLRFSDNLPIYYFNRKEINCFCFILRVQNLLWNLSLNCLKRFNCPKTCTHNEE